MSSIVSITPSESIVECDVGAVSTASFRVRNLSGRPIKVGAQIVADLAQRPWISIDGQAERYIPTNGEATFEVLVSAPADASPGRYRFGLLVFDSVEPGERFDESAAVQLAVAAPAARVTPQPPVLRVPRRSWLVTMLASLSVAFGIAIAAVGTMILVAPNQGIFGAFVFSLVFFGIPSGIIAGATTRLARSWRLVAFGAGIVFISLFLSLVFNGITQNNPAILNIPAFLISLILFLAAHIYLCRKAGPSKEA